MKKTKRNIAIVCGGDSSEHEVSLRSAQGLYGWFDRNRYNVYIVVIRRNDWHVNLHDGSIAPIDKNDFSFKNKYTKGEKTTFDYAYITIHGTATCWWRRSRSTSTCSTTTCGPLA